MNQTMRVNFVASNTENQSFETINQSESLENQVLSEQSVRKQSL